MSLLYISTIYGLEVELTLMKFRFSGHETFSCRYSWLPKAYKALEANPRFFSDEDEAIAALGVGKNMMRAIKFWVQVSGVAVGMDSSELSVTPFGRAIFSPDGFDPYLEDRKTLWLLHWNLTVHKEDPMFAWYFLFNQWSDHEFSKSQIVDVFSQETARMDRKLSLATLEQHFEIFLHTYFPTKNSKGDVLEDNLDSPFTELNLITYAGERIAKGTNHRETVYALRFGEKPDISNAIIVYCLFCYWNYYKTSESTLTFRDFSVLPNSIGQVFKLSEIDLYDRIESIRDDSMGLFEFHPSGSLPRIIRQSALTDAIGMRLLANIYQ